MVTLYRTIGPDDRSRTYSVVNPGGTDITSIELTVSRNGDGPWSDLEPTIVATIGGILGPTYVDKVVLDPSSTN